MDDATFNEAQQQQHRLLQYQPIQGYDPAQPIFHAAHSAYHHQQHHPYDRQPSDYPYHSVPPPPPGAVSATLPGDSQIHAPTALHGDLRLAAPQTHHGALELSSFGFSVPLGMNHLASQVPAAWTVGTLDRAAVAIPHPRVGGGNAQRVGGRRGRLPFRGGRGRGNFNHNPSKHGVREPSYNGKGRGQRTKGKRGGSLNHLSVAGQSPNPALVSMTGTLSVMDSNPTPAVSAALQSILPMQPLLPIAWCDICRVDCNRLEVLEQHKNGKRHKKTVQKLQEIQAQQKLMADLHSNYVGKSELAFPSAGGTNLSSLDETNIFSHLGGEKIASSAMTSAPVSSDQVGEAENAIAVSGNTNFTSETNIKPTSSATVVSSEVAETNRCSAASESLMPATAEIGHKVEPEVPCQTVATQSESSKEAKAEKEAPPSESTMPDSIDVRAVAGRGRMARMNNNDRRHGSKKRAMSYWLDGRQFKRHEVAGARNQERQKHQPIVCAVCNIRCDTLAVFECHLSGKKHISKIKRSQGHNTVFGPITVDIPPSQSTTCLPQGPEPLFYGLLSTDVFQKAAAGVAEGTQTEIIALGSQSQQQQQQLQPEIVAVGSQSKLQEESTDMHVEGLPNVPKIESDEPYQLPVV